MMTAVSIAQHAAGVKTEVKGTGMLSFIKYDSRPISIAVTAALAAAIGSATIGSATSL